MFVAATSLSWLLGGARHRLGRRQSLGHQQTSNSYVLPTPWKGSKTANRRHCPSNRRLP
jgi:hypothetical protein